MATKLERIGIRLAPIKKQRIQEVASVKGQSLTVFIERAVDKAIAEFEKEGAIAPCK